MARRWRDGSVTETSMRIARKHSRGTKIEWNTGKRRSFRSPVMWRVNVEAVTNRRWVHQLGYRVEGECGVPTRANSGRFFGLGGSNPEKAPHVLGGRGSGQNLEFPEAAPRFPSQTS